MKRWNRTDWSPEVYKEYLDYLEEQQDKEYLAFHSKLVPGKENLIGIRLPKLRQIAREISKGDVEAFLALTGETWYEEVMIEGLVIGSLKKTKGFGYIIQYVDRFIPKIDNWGVCDTFCGSLKVTKDFKEEMYAYIETLFASREEYVLRTGLVLLLSHYVEEEYVDRILFWCDRLPMEDYYVSMAAAWLLSMCFVKCREKTWAYLYDNRLDALTMRRTLQKILDSYRVSPEEKQQIRELRSQIATG